MLYKAINQLQVFNPCPIIVTVPVLELSAEEIKRWSTLTEIVKKDLIMAEEKTVYSQVRLL